MPLYSAPHLDQSFISTAILSELKLGLVANCTYYNFLYR